MPTKTAERTVAPEMQQYDREASKGEVAIFQPPRLPYHPAVEQRFGVDKGQWKVLVEAIFPAAKTVDAIVMALTYCKSRNLDPFKRPVHIVPMWDSARGAMVETVWPGISELRTTASRTKGYAGCDEATFGPAITMDFTGRVKRNGNWVDEKITVEFPEWCRITLYRIVNGERCKFVGPKVAWLESYATQGASELPNKMWQERPEGQLEKCAEAAALRRAFPEELGNELTAEEMIGRNVHDLSVDIPQIAEQTVAAGDRDTAPPRQIAKPDQSTEPAGDPEQARDGTPPRRTKPAEAKAEPKQDPISSGPPRAAAKPKDDGPKDRPPEPFRVPGTGHTFETWADQYIDLLKTSIDTATVYKWIDVNTKPFSPGDDQPMQPGPLDRLSKGKPSAYAKVKNATEETMQALRDAQQKAADKAAKKPAPPSDMDAPAGDMDGPDEPALGLSNEPTNPKAILQQIDDELSAVDDPHELQAVWDAACEPLMAKLDFQPDLDLGQALFRKHEKRLGGG